MSVAIRSAIRPQATALAQFLDRLEQENSLPKTIIYNLNPADNYVIATMIGNFQDGEVAGKIQMGSGWWFLDQWEGMQWQMNALSNQGLARAVHWYADRFAVVPVVPAARVLPPLPVRPIGHRCGERCNSR